MPGITQSAKLYTPKRRRKYNCERARAATRKAWLTGRNNLIASHTKARQKRAKMCKDTGESYFKQSTRKAFMLDKLAQHNNHAGLFLIEQGVNDYSLVERTIKRLCTREYKNEYVFKDRVKGLWTQ